MSSAPSPRMSHLPPLAQQLHSGATELRAFTDADAAVAYIRGIYEASTGRIRERFARFAGGERKGDDTFSACYPYLGLTVGPGEVVREGRPSYGSLPAAGAYATTLTRPDIFGAYLREQIELLLSHHKVPVLAGLSDHPIPLPFVIEEATAGVSVKDIAALQAVFRLPDLGRVDDDIANGAYAPPPGRPLPLSLFPAERVDLALQRLHHYTGTDPEAFQGFVLFTNYQRYVDEFVALGRDQAGRDGFSGFVEPRDASGAPATSGEQPRPGSSQPQMPAYHLVRDDGLGITLVNIGVGPSNAKTITDHLAVLRPHCWLMIGHCGGLRRSQQLGDYVLAHAYIRQDHVLDDDLPLWVPVPPIAEIQIALQEAVARVTGLRGRDLKTRMRTGTVATTDNRNWELRYAENYVRFNQSRAIAIDMESATIAANGFRLRVPYGTLLCVSDKPLEGEIKLRGMASAFYRQRVSQHLEVALEAIRLLREAGVDQLHSRKLRSFDEPAFR
jgi:AMP nucleosidase